MPVFSSMLSSTAPGGGLRYRSQMALALPKKAGSSLRLSQPRTRCGLMSASASIRPAWLAETGI